MRRLALDALVIGVSVLVVLVGAWFDASRGAACHNPELSRLLGAGLVMASALLWGRSGWLGIGARLLLPLGLSHAAASHYAVKFSLLAAPVLLAVFLVGVRRSWASPLVEGVGCEACEGACKGSRR